MRFQASANPALGKQTWELTTQGANGRFLQTASAWKARCRLAHVVSRAVPLWASSPANVPSGALRCYSWLPPAWTEGRRTCPLPRARHHHHRHHYRHHVIVTAAATTADAQGALAPSNHCAGYFNHVFAVNSQNIPQDKWIRTRERVEALQIPHGPKQPHHLHRKPGPSPRVCCGGGRVLTALQTGSEGHLWLFLCPLPHCHTYCSTASCGLCPISDA